MALKKPLQSKTVQYGGAITITGVALEILLQVKQSEELMSLIGQYAPTAAAVIGIGITVLRFVTTSPLDTKAHRENLSMLEEQAYDDDAV